MEQLPKRSKSFRDPDGYRQGNIPYKRAYRFLVSRRGQPWDHVLSELIHADWLPQEARTVHFARRSLGVELDTFIDNGKVKYYDYCCHASDPVKSLEDDVYRDVFYVDPVTRVLQYRPKSRRHKWHSKRQEQVQKYCRIIGEYHQFIQIHGIWFEVWIDKEKITPRIRQNIKPYQMLLTETGSGNYKPRWGTREYWDYDHLLNVPIKQRQISSKELRQNGLVNEPKIEHKKLGGRKLVTSVFNNW